MGTKTHTKSFDIDDTIFHDLARAFHLDPTLPNHLYTCPFTVQAVFRALPPLARLYIPRLLNLPPNHPIPLHHFRNTLRRRQRAKDRHEIAIRALRSLNILSHSPDINNHTNNNLDDHPNTPLYLHPKFAHNLRRAITYATPHVFDGPMNDSLISPEQLDNFSADRLENILNYVVESSGRRPPSGRILSSLVFIHILEQNQSALCITSSGFHFLLKHSFAQLWILLRSVLLACYSSNLLQPLKFLFSLSFAHPGALYSIHSLNEQQLDILSELHELGIIILSQDGQSFRPTLVGVRLLASANRVGADLTSADLPNVTKTTGEINIFVETNFRVYAYTTSEFQTNLLSLFTLVRCRLPGMVVGHLTRDEVRKALMNGITAEQIIAYLNAHAHPRMKRGIIPSNVSDEIRLWEAEQERVQLQTGVLLSKFETTDSFERLLTYANSLDAVLWFRTETHQLVVEAEHYDAIRQFVRSEGLQ